MSCRKCSTTCVKSASSCTAWDTWHLISRCLKHRVICHLTRSWHGWPHPCLRPPQSCQSMWSPATFQCINNFNHSHFTTQYHIHIHRPHNSKIRYCRKSIAISSEQKPGPWKRPTYWPCHKRIIAIWDAPPLPTVATSSLSFLGDPCKPLLRTVTGRGHPNINIYEYRESVRELLFETRSP